MQTIIGVNDPKAIKIYSAQLMVDTAKESYFTSKFMGKGEDSPTPINMLTNLEKDPGDTISYDLSVRLKGMPVEGDGAREGKEKDLKWHTDSVKIDQMWSGVDPGGKMSRKRTLHDLRVVAKDRLAEYFATLFDEIFFIYLSGARGVNTNFFAPLDWAGRAGNAIEAPDAAHIIYGDGTSKATLTAAGKMTTAVIDKCVAKAETLGGGVDAEQRLLPVKIEGGKHFVLLMHSFAAYDLRRDSGSLGWMEIQKAAAGAVGMKSPIFNGMMGMHNNVILHKHENCIRFSDYGAGSNVEASRALFMGKQAGVLAFGSTGTGLRFNWHEEQFDRGNRLSISADTIAGCKKTRFNDKDFGLLSVDVACVDPNA
jgi:N4-gp56 family major capsid protein